MNGDEIFRRRRAIEMRTPRETRFFPHTPMGTGAEFDAIRRMLERWGPHARRIGDDAGVITTLGDRALVVSTDTSVENIHFRAEWLSPKEIGYRGAAAALSDLAAMGAKPIGLLSALAVPESWRIHLDAITDGIGEAASFAGAPIIGGDMSRGGELALTFTVLGTTRDVLFRTLARPGDKVYVTGRLGGPHAALRALQAGGEPSPAHRERFARPVPRILEAMWLAENGVNAAIDISDGLSADLLHLASASRVAISVDLGLLPLVDDVSPLEGAGSGEEYEIAVTAPSNLDIDAFEHRFGLELTEIGVVEQGAADVKFFIDGAEVSPPAGYSHFTK